MPKIPKSVGLAQEWQGKLPRRKPIFLLKVISQNQLTERGQVMRRYNFQLHIEIH